MNNLDQMKLIKLCVKDLDEAVCAYEGSRMKNPNTVDYLWGLPKYHTRESIRRRIVQLRQDLLQLGKGFEHGRE